MLQNHKTLQLIWGSIDISIQESCNKRYTIISSCIPLGNITAIDITHLTFSTLKNCSYTCKINVNFSTTVNKKIIVQYYLIFSDIHFSHIKIYLVQNAQSNQHPYWLQHQERQLHVCKEIWSKLYQSLNLKVDQRWKCEN